MLENRTLKFFLLSGYGVVYSTEAQSNGVAYPITRICGTFLIIDVLNTRAGNT